MAAHFRRIADYLKHAFARRQIDDRGRLEPRSEDVPPRVPGGSTVNAEALAQRWEIPGLPADARPVLAPDSLAPDAERDARNIEEVSVFRDTTPTVWPRCSSRAARTRPASPKLPSA